MGGRVERLIGGGAAPRPGTGGGVEIDERDGGGDIDGRAEILVRGAGGGGGGCLLYGSQFVFLRGTLECLSRVFCILVTLASLAFAAFSFSSANEGMASRYS